LKLGVTTSKRLFPRTPWYLTPWKMVEYGKPLEGIGCQIDRLPIPVIPFDAEHAKIVASMWKASRLADFHLATGRASPSVCSKGCRC
jgi:hypothetical protein